MVFKILSSFFISFYCVSSLAHLAYGSLPANDIIHLFDGAQKIVHNNYVYEIEVDDNKTRHKHLGLCTKGNCIIFRQYEGKMTIYKLNTDLLDNKEWAGKNKVGGSLTDEQLKNGWKLLSEAAQYDQYQEYLLVSLKKGAENFQIRLPPFDRKIYGVKHGEAGGSKKNRFFDLDVQTKKIKFKQDSVFVKYIGDNNFEPQAIK